MRDREREEEVAEELEAEGRPGIEHIYSGFSFLSAGWSWHRPALVSLALVNF
jgi:hypothetical protein